MLCVQKMEAAGDPETSSSLPSSAAITAARGEGVTPHPDSANKMVVNYNNEQITNREQKKKNNSKHVQKVQLCLCNVSHLFQQAKNSLKHRKHVWSLSL